MRALQYRSNTARQVTWRSVPFFSSAFLRMGDYKGEVMKRQAVAASVALVSGLAMGGSAVADTIWVEAESCRDPFRGTITSPLMIKDDTTASGASYIEVAPGNNSQTSMPASEGVST